MHYVQNTGMKLSASTINSLSVLSSIRGWLHVVVVVVVECIYKPFTVATSSAECNRCSSHPAWTGGGLQYV